jgi:hypothetical protein
MRRKSPMTLYEVTAAPGGYHEHWLARSPLDVARRAVSHAAECNLALHSVNVASMTPPANRGKGGLVYVMNDTRTYAVVRGSIRRAGLPGRTSARKKGVRSHE